MSVRSPRRPARGRVVCFVSFPLSFALALRCLQIIENHSHIVACTAAWHPMVPSPAMKEAVDLTKSHLKMAKLWAGDVRKDPARLKELTPLQALQLAAVLAIGACFLSAFAAGALFVALGVLVVASVTLGCIFFCGAWAFVFSTCVLLGFVFVLATGALWATIIAKAYGAVFSKRDSERKGESVAMGSAQETSGTKAAPTASAVPRPSAAAKHQ